MPLTAALFASRHALFAFLALVMIGGGLLACSPPAWAHASLTTSEPVDGVTLAQPPARFALSFSEPTSPLLLRLITPDGASLPLERFTLRDRTLDIEAPSNLGNGTHVLSWRVVSEDGHPVGGSVVFSIGAPGNAPPVLAAGAEPSVRLAIWAVRVLLYAGLFIGIGGAFCLAWLSAPARDGERLITVALLVGAGAAVLSIGLQGVDALEAPLAGLTRALVWQAGFATSLGTTVLVALLAVMLAVVSLVVPLRIGRGLVILSLAALGVALAASGHASAAPPQGLTRPAVFLHGIGIALWAGALAPLALLFARGSVQAGAILRRFSVFIPFAVLPLAASGVMLAAIQLGSFAALWDTAYGLVLLAKLLMVVLLFALAAYNRLRLTGPAEQNDTRARRQLIGSIRVEIALVLAIFAIAALWRFTPPPRALALAAAQPAQVHIHALKAMADLTVTPGRVGPTDVSLVLMSGEFGPLDAKEVTLVLANPARGIEPIRRKVERREGIWRIDGLVFPAAGEWDVRIDILITDFEMTRLEGQLSIRN